MNIASTFDLGVNLLAAGHILNVDSETSTIQDTATATNLEPLDGKINSELQEVEDISLHGLVSVLHAEKDMCEIDKEAFPENTNTESILINPTSDE